MSELTRLSQLLIDEPLAASPSLDDLRLRSRRRRQRRRSGFAGMLALVVIGAFSIAKIEDSFPSPSGSSKTKTVEVQLASYYRAAVSVPNSTLERVGLPGSVAIPTKITPSISTVVTNGVVSYVGAEYCPFCAIQRWALLVALSKFGTFTNLDKQVLSSSSDVYPRLASWSFIDAKYTSTYFTFDPTEVTSSIPGNDGGYRPLEKMSAVQRLAYDRYNPQGVLLFVDVGNHYVTLGASSSPSVLEGLTLGAIGRDLDNPASPVAQAIDGTANYLIAAMCTMAQGMRPPICSTLTMHRAPKILDTGVSPTAKTSSSTVAPTQPPTNAPMSVWKKWSAEMPAFWLAAAADYRDPNRACTIISMQVTGRKLTKPLLGIPAGVTVWAMSGTGKCNPKMKTNGAL